MAERVEWIIHRFDEKGIPRRHMEGAQGLFGLTRAQEICKKLGEDWQVLHHVTMVTPAEHEAWLKGRGNLWST